MNVQKINNHLNYWHSVDELPKIDVPILIETNTFTDLYFVGKLNKDYHKPLVYPLTTYSLTETRPLIETIKSSSLTQWFGIVKRWMYLKDLKELIG